MTGSAHAPRRTDGAPASRRRTEVDGAIEAAVAAGGAALCGLAVAITIAGNDSTYAWLEGVARGVMVGAPIAVGLYARRRPPFGVTRRLTRDQATLVSGWCADQDRYSAA